MNSDFKPRDTTPRHRNPNLPRHRAERDKVGEYLEWLLPAILIGLFALCIVGAWRSYYEISDADQSSEGGTAIISE